PPGGGGPPRRGARGQGDIRWTTAIDEIPDDAPLFLVANEFFDALPIRQYVKATRGWHERRIGADGDKLVFALAADPTPGLAVPDAPEGAVFETSSAARAIVSETAARIAHSGRMA